MASLGDKTISGIFWAFLQKVGSRGIIFIVMILLARLLTPEDFGLIGMLTIFIQISQAVVEGGFNLALIQKKNPDDEDYSSVFYINLVASFLLYFILFFSAPFIADFYEQPILISLIRVLGLVFVFNSFSFVQETRLTKEIRFKTLMYINIPSTVIGGIVSVIMAVLGFGVWSIVAMQLVTRLAYALQIWVYAKWRPLFAFNVTKAKGLFSFGGKLLISKITGTIYNNIFLIIIGKFYPVSSVGYYQNAFNLVSIPSGTITSVLNGVTFSAFSSIQDDNARLKAGYKRVMQQAFFWICPMYVFAGVLAAPLFEFVFTAKWATAVPYFQWLCIVGILQPLNTYNLNILNVKGRSDLFLRLQAIRRALTILAVIAIFPLGITALLVVQAASTVFTFMLFSYYSGKFIYYSLKEQASDILPIFLLSIGVGTAIFLADQTLVGLSNLVRLLVGFGLGSGVYWLFASYFRLAPYLDFKVVFQNKVLNKFMPKN